MRLLLFSLLTIAVVANNQPELSCSLPSYGLDNPICSDTQQCCGGFECVGGSCGLGRLNDVPESSRSLAVALLAQITTKDITRFAVQLSNKVDRVVDEIITRTPETSQKLLDAFTAGLPALPQVENLSTVSIESFVATEKRKDTLEKQITKLQEEVTRLKKKLSALEKDKTKATKGALVPGMEGGPCGKTNYKDFGSCKGRLQCVSDGNLFATGWVPGTCTNKPVKTVKTNSTANLAKTEATQGGPPGALNGPCGSTPFFNFGPCNAGLSCVLEPSLQAAMQGMGMCKVSSKKKHHHIGRRLDSAADDTSKTLAESTNSLALETAAQSEELAKELLAVAAYLRQAAVELSKSETSPAVLESATQPDASTAVFVPVQETQPESQRVILSPFFMITLSSAIVTAGIWRLRKFQMRSQYERI